MPLKSEPYMIAAQHTLRKKIGAKVDLHKVFAPDALAVCQKIIDDAHSGFLSDMQAQVTALGAEYMKVAEDPSQADAVLKKAIDDTHIIKKRMEELGFLFGFQVAKSLCDYVQSTPLFNADVLLIVCKHIAVLNLIIKDGITGDGGKVGQEMLANLKKLIRKVEA